MYVLSPPHSYSGPVSQYWTPRQHCVAPGPVGMSAAEHPIPETTFPVPAQADPVPRRVDCYRLSAACQCRVDIPEEISTCEERGREGEREEGGRKEGGKEGEGEGERERESDI